MLNKLLKLFGYKSKTPIPTPLTREDTDFLESNVSFFSGLNNDDKTTFHKRCLLFLDDTEIYGHKVEVTREDELLLASGSVILAWGFEKWHYVRVDTVILVPASFNESSEFGKDDSTIQGLVGNQHLAGKMILSKPALHAGFSNDKDKKNVAIHEFAHLIDIADGEVDGFPEQISQYSERLPWLDLIQKNMQSIERGQSSIRKYASTNHAEFFAVTSEYFFERPRLLQQKHPEIYQSLKDYYQQDCSHIQHRIKIRKKAPCPCGSGKRYKRCCMPKD